MADGNFLMMPVTGTTVYPCPDAHTHALMAVPVVSGTSVKLHYRAITESGRNLWQGVITVPATWTLLKTLLPSIAPIGGNESWDGIAILVHGIEGGYIFYHTGTKPDDTFVTDMDEVDPVSMVFAGDVIGQASPIRPQYGEIAHPSHQLPLVSASNLSGSSITMPLDPQVPAIFPTNHSGRLVLELNLTTSSTSVIIAPQVRFKLADYGCLGSSNPITMEDANYVSIALSSYSNSTANIQQMKRYELDIPAAGRYFFQVILTLTSGSLSEQYDNEVNLWQFIH